MKLRIPLGCASVALVLAVGLVRPARALTASGTVTDLNLAPVAQLKVEVYKEAFPVHELVATVYTDANGQYTSAAVNPGENVYVLVKWELPFLPVLTFGGRGIRLLARGAGDPFIPTTTYQSKASTVATNINADITLNVVLDQAQPAALGTLRQRVQWVVDYFAANHGATPWTLTADIPVRIITDSDDRMDPTGIYVDQATFNGVGGTTQQVDLFHEVGHYLHFLHNGNSLPNTLPTCSDHAIDSEEDIGCALTEGYASYLAQLVAEQKGIVSQTYRSYRDDGFMGFFPANGLWRGDDLPAETGLDNGTFESGAVVEGAFGGFVFAVHDSYGGLPTVYKAMTSSQPNNVFQLFNSLVAQTPDPGQKVGLQLLLETHGVVLNRARFQSSAFAEGPPPDFVPPEPGNHKLINNLTFLRGKVNARFEPVPAQLLGNPNNGLAIASVQVIAQPASNGTLSAPAFPLLFSPSPSNNNQAEVNTLDLDGADGDGNWDLALRAISEHGYADLFFPTWVGDGNLAVNTDERYLKVIGTWYDRDRNPATNPDTEGMVVVDNTPPTVTNFKP